MGKLIDGIRRERARNRPSAMTMTQANTAPTAGWGSSWNPNTGNSDPNARVDPVSGTAREGSVASVSFNGQDFFDPRTITPDASLTDANGNPLQRGTHAFNVAQSNQVRGIEAESPWTVGQVKGNQAGNDAAMAALAQMRERSNSGWSQLDRMALDQAQRQAGQYEQAQRGANQASMASRGMRGSGLEMLGAMNAQQGGADRALGAATDLGIAGRDRATTNTASAAQLGMGLDQQQYDQSMARAQGVDAMNMWATGKHDDAAATVFQSQMAAAANRMQQNNYVSGMMNGYANTASNMFRRNGGSSGGGE